MELKNIHTFIRVAEFRFSSWKTSCTPTCLSAMESAFPSLPRDGNF